jgi:hypothetical protein
MADFSVRADHIDVEQIMRQIRSRIRDKRGADYTEEEIRELAAVKLEKFLDPRAVRSDLLQHYRQQHQPVPLILPEEAHPPLYNFTPQTVYVSDRGVAGRILTIIRKILKPITKLFFHVDTVWDVLSKQSVLNAQHTRMFQRAHQRFVTRDELDSLNFEMFNNLVVELTRLGIEVKNLRMQVESFGTRLDFDERRARALEGVVQYRPGATVAKPPPPSPAGGDEDEEEPLGAGGEGGDALSRSARRRRRRRGRRRGPGEGEGEGEGTNGEGVRGAGEAREARQPYEARQPGESRQPGDPRQPTEPRQSQEPRQPYESRQPREGREPREQREPREPRESRDAREPFAPAAAASAPTPSSVAPASSAAAPAPATAYEPAPEPPPTRAPIAPEPASEPFFPEPPSSTPVAAEPIAPPAILPEPIPEEPQRVFHRVFDRPHDPASPATTHEDATTASASERPEPSPREDSPRADDHEPSQS